MKDINFEPAGLLKIVLIVKHVDFKREILSTMFQIRIFIFKDYWCTNPITYYFKCRFD